MAIQLLKKQGSSLGQIAAEVGCAVKTVRRHLALEAVPKCERQVVPKPKIVAVLPGENYHGDGIGVPSATLANAMATVKKAASA